MENRAGFLEMFNAVSPTIVCRFLTIGRNRSYQAVGGNLLALSAGEWVHFDVVAGLGESSTGTWELTVTLPGEKPRRFSDLKNRDAGWKTITWIGFVSMATDKKVFYLDNIELLPVRD